MYFLSMHFLSVHFLSVHFLSASVLIASVCASTPTLALDGPLAPRSTGTANITLHIPERAEILPMQQTTNTSTNNTLCLFFSPETTSFLLSPVSLWSSARGDRLSFNLNGVRYEISNNETEEIVLPAKTSTRHCESGYSLAFLKPDTMNQENDTVALIFEPS